MGIFLIFLGIGNFVVVIVVLEPISLDVAAAAMGNANLALLEPIVHHQELPHANSARKHPIC